MSKEPESCAEQDECSGECSTCPSAATATEQERMYRLQQKRLEERQAEIRHQLLVLSGKGGVGKSTVSANLASALADRGLQVGLLDADLHGPTIPLMLGVQGQRAQGANEAIEPVRARPGLSVMSMGFLLAEASSPVIWRGPIRANALRQMIADVEWGPLDFLIVDLPPGTGDEPLTMAQSLPQADGAIVVTTPQEASLSDCRKAVNFVRAVELPVLGVIENMSGFVCPHCGETTDVFDRGGGEQMASEMDVPFLGRVPLLAEIVRLSDAGQGLSGDGAPEAAKAAFGSIIANLLRPMGVETRE